MGDYLRRFRLPFGLASELPGPGFAPARFTLLGEKLVAFRDSADKLGLVAENCPHRGASLFFGRNEKGSALRPSPLEVQRFWLVREDAQ